MRLEHCSGQMDKRNYNSRVISTVRGISKRFSSVLLSLPLLFGSTARAETPKALAESTGIAATADANANPNIVVGVDYDLQRFELPTLDGNSTQKLDQTVVSASIAIRPWAVPLFLVERYTFTSATSDFELAGGIRTAIESKHSIIGGLRLVLNGSVGTFSVDGLGGSMFGREYETTMDSQRAVNRPDGYFDAYGQAVYLSPEKRTMILARLARNAQNPSGIALVDHHIPSFADNFPSVLQLQLASRRLFLQQNGSGVGETPNGREYEARASLKVPLVGSESAYLGIGPLAAFEYFCPTGGCDQSTTSRLSAGGGIAGVFGPVRVSADYARRQNDNLILLTAGLWANHDSAFAGASYEGGFGAPNARSVIARAGARTEEKRTRPNCDGECRTAVDNAVADALANAIRESAARPPAPPVPSEPVRPAEPPPAVEEAEATVEPGEETKLTVRVIKNEYGTPIAIENPNGERIDIPEKLQGKNSDQIQRYIDELLFDFNNLKPRARIWQKTLNDLIDAGYLNTGHVTVDGQLRTSEMTDAIGVLQAKINEYIESGKVEPMAVTEHTEASLDIDRLIGGRTTAQTPRFLSRVIFELEVMRDTLREAESK